MPSTRDTPHGARNFRVRVGLLGPRGGRGEERELAFSEVILPPFRLKDRVVPDDRDEPDRGAPRNLVLRRGHTGASELYEWWRAERDAERLRVREVTVMLLDETSRTVTSWRFTGCHLVSLQYSPLDALDSGALMETVELSFTSVDQFGADD